jgi:hypothetical protein
MADALTADGFKLIGGGPLIDADKPAMERAIRAFGAALRNGAVGLFYYSGHGVQINGANYLIPVSANVSAKADIKYEMLDASFVLDEMANAGNRLNIVILDACRNNPFVLGGARDVSMGLAQVIAPAGTVISYATQPGSVASDGASGNSPYTAALAAAIRAPGRDLFATFNDVGLAVKNATRGRQQPWLAVSPIEGDFFFAPPGVAATNQAQPDVADDALWNAVKDETSPEAVHLYLRTFPKGRHAHLARLKIKQSVSPAEIGEPPPPAPPETIAAVAPPEILREGDWSLRSERRCGKRSESTTVLIHVSHVGADQADVQLGGNAMRAAISGQAVTWDLHMTGLDGGAYTVAYAGTIISPTQIQGDATFTADSDGTPALAACHAHWTMTTDQPVVLRAGITSAGLAPQPQRSTL